LGQFDGDFAVELVKFWLKLSWTSEGDEFVLYTKMVYIYTSLASYKFILICGALFFDFSLYACVLCNSSIVIYSSLELIGRNVYPIGIIICHIGIILSRPKLGKRDRRSTERTRPSKPIRFPSTQTHPWIKMRCTPLIIHWKDFINNFLFHSH